MLLFHSVELSAVWPGSRGLPRPGFSGFATIRPLSRIIVLSGTVSVIIKTAKLFNSGDQKMKDLADVALNVARQRGASYADIRYVRTLNKFVTTREKRVENVTNTESYGFGVRVLVDGAWGFAASSDVQKEEIARVAERAVSIAKAQQGDPAQPRHARARSKNIRTRNTPRPSSATRSPFLCRKRRTTC